MSEPASDVRGVGERQAIEAAVARALPGGRVERISPMTGGVSANVLRVDVVETGGERRRLVFRQHRSTDFKAHGHAVTTTEFEVLGALCERGFAVPRPVLLDASGTSTAPFFLMEWVEGATEVVPSALSSSLRQMAEFLARLHALRPADLGISGLEALEDPATSLPEHLPADDSGAQVRSVILDGRFERAANPPALVHGDFWPGNVIWAAGRLAAVVDWEDVRIGDPIADLAAARLELHCRYGEQAAEDFTARYGESSSGGAAALGTGSLPLWEVYAAASALATMGGWGLVPAEERRRRAATEQFYGRAVAALLEAGPRRRPRSRRLLKDQA